MDGRPDVLPLLSTPPAPTIRPLGGPECPTPARCSTKLPAYCRSLLPVLSPSSTWAWRRWGKEPGPYLYVNRQGRRVGNLDILSEGAQVYLFSRPERCYRHPGSSPPTDLHCNPAAILAEGAELDCIAVAQLVCHRSLPIPTKIFNVQYLLELVYTSIVSLAEKGVDRTPLSRQRAALCLTSRRCCQSD